MSAEPLVADRASGGTSGPVAVDKSAVLVDISRPMWRISHRNRIGQIGPSTPGAQMPTVFFRFMNRTIHSAVARIRTVIGDLSTPSTRLLRTATDRKYSLEYR